jgi:hypothetical protein
MHSCTCLELVNGTVTPNAHCVIIFLLFALHVRKTPINIHISAKGKFTAFLGRAA